MEKTMVTFAIAWLSFCAFLSLLRICSTISKEFDKTNLPRHQAAFVAIFATIISLAFWAVTPWAIYILAIT